MLRPAIGLSPEPLAGGTRGVAFGIQSIQIIAMQRCVFLRVLTQPTVMTPFDAAIHRSIKGWRIDGIAPILHSIETSIVFHSRQKGEMYQQVRVDLRLPLNSPIEIQLGNYVEPILPTFQADDGVAYSDEQIMEVQHATVAPTVAPTVVPEVAPASQDVGFVSDFQNLEI